MNQRGNIQIIIGVIFLLLILVGGRYYLGIQNNQPQTKQDQNNNTESLIPQASLSTTVNLISKNEAWEEYTSQKLPSNSLKAYTINYPSSWARDVKREQETIDTLTLSKEGNTINIWQGPSGGGGCIFDGDMPEGPYSDYRNVPFTEIESNFGTLRRIQTKADKPDQVVFAFCIKSTNEDLYISPTQVGAISYTLHSKYDSNILEEMDKIVATLK